MPFTRMSELMLTRSLILTAAVVVGAVVPAAEAQRGAPPALPVAVTRDLESVYNTPGTRREGGAVEIAADVVVRGNLAVRLGPVTVAGHIEGSLVAINADVTLLPSARIDGDVLVVGGRVDGRSEARIGGDVRVYAEQVRYRMEDERLIVEGVEARPQSDSAFWRGRLGDRTRFDLVSLATASTYNRVEGLPVLIGPRLRLTRPWGALTVEARGIVRTAEPVRWDRGTLGHSARVALRRGERAGVGVELQHYDEVTAVEDWQMSAGEAGFGAFLLHRDFRDHFGRHGGRATVRGYLSDEMSLSLSVADERWSSREARRPWTLIRSDDPWRPNPTVDAGKATVATVALDVDTRTQRYSPWAGWYLRAEVERGDLTATALGERSAATWPIDPGPTASTWTRGFFDVRRYNRLAPGAQLNLRFVYGGWLGGDALPLQRRLSVGGPATLPGFDFRRHWRGGEDRLQCSDAGGAVPGMPALCDRVALAQVEFRSTMSFDLSDFDHEWIPAEINGPTWMLFANAGRGWRARGESGSTYAVTSFPAFDTFKTDLGVGLDFGSVSVALAKSVSDAKEPVNVIVRLERRF
jgi:hypothetical protein